VEAGARFAGEAFRSARAREEIACRSDDALTRFAEAQTVVREHNQNALRRRRQGRKAELDHAAHRASGSFSSESPTLRNFPLPHRQASGEMHVQKATMRDFSVHCLGWATLSRH